MYNPADVPMPVQQFITSIRRRALNDLSVNGASQASIGYLAGMITKRTGVKEHDTRIAMLQAITGLPIKESKQLTQVYVSVLIEEVTNDADGSKLQYIKELLEKQTGRRPWDLFPWDAPRNSMSIM